MDIYADVIYAESGSVGRVLVFQYPCHVLLTNILGSVGDERSTLDELMSRSVTVDDGTPIDGSIVKGILFSRHLPILYRQ